MDQVNGITDNVKNITYTYKNKFADKLPTFATGAATLTAALAWNEAAKKSIAYYFPMDEKNSARATIIYALTLTFIVVLILVIIDHLSKSIKESFSSENESEKNKPENESLNENYNEKYNDYKLHMNKYQYIPTLIN